MTDTQEPLDSGFPDQDLNAWRALAEKALKGAPLDSLTRRTADGLDRGPLMTGADRPETLRHLPRATGYPWDIVTHISHPDPARANAQLRADLDAGATAAEITIDPTGAHGVRAATLSALETTLEGVDLMGVPIRLGAGAYAPAAAAALDVLLRKRGIAADAVRGAVLFDPFGDTAARGDTAAPADAVSDALAWSVRPGLATLSADGRRVHEAGGTAAQAIAWAVACGLAYLKTAEAAGHSLKDASSRLEFAQAVDADVHQSITSIRALRTVWARIANACGVDANANVAIYGSRRMLTGHDPWTNLVRLSAAGFAGAAGGADVLVLSTFTDALGSPSDQARRLSRNIQILLRDESGVGRVDDPAFGSYHHEALTRALAEKAWGLFQDIERVGGAAAFAASGDLATWVRTAREALNATIADGSNPIIGVTKHRAPDDQPASVEDVPPPTGVDGATATPVERTPDAFIAAIDAGASFSSLVDMAASAPTISDLAPMRLTAEADHG